MPLRVLVVLWTIIHTYQAFEIGKSFSVLDGLKPVLPNANSFNQILYPVQRSNLFQNVQTKTVQNSYSQFGPFIQLTYHADENDLIKGFFSMWEFSEEKRYAGPFIHQQNVNGETNSSEYSSLLGISPENLVGKVYVLARYWKKLNTTMAVDVTTSPLANVFLNAGSNKILEKFSEYGTHYVSGYQMGDLIYQVFVYDKNDAEKVLKFSFDNPAYGFGHLGHYYRMYTELKTESGVGFCLEAGKILTASNDPAWLNIASQLRDDVFRVPESIFMFVVKYGGYLLSKKLTTIIPIKFYFKPMVTKLLPGDSRSQKVWNDVLSAAVFQKFGPESQPNFPTIIDSGIEDFYDSFNPSLVTSTATNYVTITRMSFVLNDFFIFNPTFVTHVFIFADVLKLRASKIKLPGSQKIYLICREMVALSSNNIVPEIIFGAYDNSVPTVKIVAKTMRGVFKVTQAKTNEHFTYANDEVYKTSKHPSHSGVGTDSSKRLYKPDRISLPELYSSENALYEMKWLQDGLVSSVQLSVTTIESILAIRASTNSVNTARKCLEWMINFLTMKKTNGTTQLSTDLEMAFGRALLIRKTQLNEYAQFKRLVPKLTFSVYKPLYDKLLTEVSAYENTFQTISTKISYHKHDEKTTKTMKELNDNVKRIGSFLVQETEAGAQYQDDIARTNQQLHDLESDRISREQEQAAILWTEITNTQKEVTDAGIAFKEAIEKYKTEQIFSAVFSVISVVGSLFTGGVGALNIAKDIEGIIRVAKQVEIAIGIIEQVNKMYSLGRELRNDIGKVNRAMENIPSFAVDADSFPTDLEWEDFDVDVMSYTSYLPDQVHREALDFQRVAKRLSARGRKYLSIAANIAAMKYKQINLEMQRDLAKRQSDRLRALKTTVIQKDITDNAANTTDLFEIGTIIKMRENQVRTHLVQSFGFMDAALQYYYFQKPTVIKRYDTLSIQTAAAKQVQSSITILERFPSAPEDLKRPIEYNIPGVRVQELLSPDGCEKEIKLSSAEFQNYIRVRILRVEVRADNIANVSNNEAYIEAIASGETFQDRDLDRNPISFTTAPKSYRFTYNIVTKDAIITSQPSSDFDSNFIKMTPFDKWVFRLPNVTTNKDLRFSSELTTLRIKFYVNAIFDPPRISSRRRRIRRSDVFGSKHDLLQRINGRSLVRNWDAIMAVSAERVNEIWKQQYDNQTKAGFVKSIATESTVDSDYSFMITYARCFLEVGPPKIQFIQHNQNEVTLTIEIKSGQVEFTSFYKTENGQILENSSKARNRTIHQNVSIKANVKLSQIKGELTKESLVVLDMSTAIVDVPRLVNGASTTINIATQIRTFFAKRLNSTDFEVARITYEDTLTPPSLVPDRFYLATGGFKSDGSGYGSLFIFFRTRSTSSSATAMTQRDFNDPVSIGRQVIPNGYEVALFISNRIIFGDIILKDVQNSLSFGVHTKNLPGLSESQQSKYIVGDFDAKYHFTLRAKAGKVDVSISARKFKVRSSNRGKKIKVTWEADNQPIRIPYHVKRCFGNLMYKCRDELRRKTKNFYVKFVKYYKPNIDQSQTITYTGESATVNVDSDSVSGWDVFLRNGLEVNRAKNEIESKVRHYLQKLGFNFRSISTFAITQVIFPNQDVFQLEEVYIPGDMVIIGRVKKDMKK